MVIALLFVIAITGVRGQAVECPTRNGLYADPIQCDKYHDCFNGQAEEHICEDGLVFDDQVGRCDYPFMVNCENRTQLQLPISRNKKCPRANGFFEHEDPTQCSVYYWCINGIANQFYCDDDLHFNKETALCVWTHLSDRTDCTTHVVVHESGFICPKTTQYAINGQKLHHTLFIDESDCQYFYTCLNGKTPKRHGCPSGLVFNDILLECDLIENVPECVADVADDRLLEDTVAVEQQVN